MLPKPESPRSSPCCSLSCDLSTIYTERLPLQCSHGCWARDSFSHVTGGGGIEAEPWRSSVKPHWSYGLSIFAFFSFSHANRPVLWLVLMLAKPHGGRGGGLELTIDCYTNLWAHVCSDKCSCKLSPVCSWMCSIRNRNHKHPELFQLQEPAGVH